jgi:hypothetical protein
MIIEQEESADEHDGGLQRTIRRMRQASNFVRDLVDAEEGRGRQCTCHHDVERVEAEGSVKSSGSSDVPPSYRSDVTPPPGYSMSLDGEIVLINGFGYTPSTSTADDVTESSVVDCSPRISFDTRRSRTGTLDSRDES